MKNIIRTIPFLVFLLASITRTCAASFATDEASARQKHYNDITTTWKTFLETSPYKFQSYIPLWYMSEEDSIIHFIFDKKYIFEADCRRIGFFIRHTPTNISNFTFYKTLSSSRTGKDKRHDLTDKKYNEIINSIQRQADLRPNERVIVVDLNDANFIAVAIHNFRYVTEREILPGLCASYVAYEANNCYEFDPDEVQKLAKRYSDISINSHDYTLLTQYKHDYLSEYYSSNFSSWTNLYCWDDRSIKKQIKAKYGKEKDINDVFLKIGAYDLLTNTEVSSDTRTFLGAYNNNIVEHLYKEQKIETDCFRRIKFESITHKIAREWVCISWIFVAISILIYFSAKRFKFRFDMLWLVSLSLALATAYFPLPDPLVAIGIMNLGWVLPVTICAALFQLPAVNTFTFIAIFLLYLYSILIHKILKKIRKKDS